MEWELKPQQQEVLDRFKQFVDSEKDVFVLKGYAGTGKTTMIRSLANWMSQRNLRFQLCAPTGRAAKVLGEKTGHPACTVHRAIYSFASLEYNENDYMWPRYRFSVIRFPDVDNQAESGSEDDSCCGFVLLVDEASMVSSRYQDDQRVIFGSGVLLDDILEFLKNFPHGKVVFVGDPAQLPPVGDNASNALCEAYLMQKGLVVESCMLTEVLRQSDNNLILANAMQIRNLIDAKERNKLVFEYGRGQVTALSPSDFPCVFVQQYKVNPESVVLVTFSNALSHTYNKKIRNLLFPAKVELCIGDRLIVVKNNYSYDHIFFNGDMCLVKKVKGRETRRVPLFVGKTGEPEVEELTFLTVDIEIPEVGTQSVKIFENLLYQESHEITLRQCKALFIDFKIRNRGISEKSPDFLDALREDPYYNALWVRFGYAITAHKAQGGEWENVLVDFQGRRGLSTSHLQWSYTATTRASHCLFTANAPCITPLSGLKVMPITLAKKFSEKHVLYDNVPSTPFHTDNQPDFLKVKYWGVVEALADTEFQLVRVYSYPYCESYIVSDVHGSEWRFDLTYKMSGNFTGMRYVASCQGLQPTPLEISLIEDCLRKEACVGDISYKPQGEVSVRVFSLLASFCEQFDIVITNVEEFPSQYEYRYYLKTPFWAYLKVFYNRQGFISSIVPFSEKADADTALSDMLERIRKAAFP